MNVFSRIVEMAARAFDPEAHPPTPGEECAPEAGDVGFTAAVIGLAAKMARADGVVSASEVEAAARVFQPPPGEEAAFRRAFAIARQTVLGYESYARQIGRRYRSRPCLLEDVLDGLFRIAGADGVIGPSELAYLETVSRHFGFSPRTFKRILVTHTGVPEDDPYAVLGLPQDASLEDARRAWRALAAEYHPDAMASRGAPEAFVRLATDKTARLNAAFAKIRAELAAPVTAG